MVLWQRSLFDLNVGQFYSECRQKSAGSMNDSSPYIKWFYRTALVAFCGPMIYVVTRPSYNFAHWVPHNIIRRLGVSYEDLLWAEQNADVPLHLLGAAILVVLVHRAALPWFSLTPSRSFVTVVVFCISAEGLQFVNGRGVETSDLLLGILGSFVAYLAIDKTNLSLT